MVTVENYGPMGPLHSRTPWYYTTTALFLTVAFFVQPLTWREAFWTWVTKQTDHELLLFVFGSWIVHMVTFIGSNSVMALIYRANSPFLEQFKIQKKPWPWNRSEKDRAEYFELIKKSLKVICINQFILAPLLMASNLETFKKLGLKLTVDTVAPWYVSIVQITVFMMVEDCMFYWLHRFLHWSAIYGYIHKHHHQYKVTIGIASEYAHPLEFVLSNAIPFTAGPLIVAALSPMGVHLLTFWMWTILRVGETVDGHCGYEFPWSPYRLLPFSGSSSVHDFHHSHNIGNYASFFTYWDRLCGTAVAYERYVEKQEAEWQAKKAAGGAVAPAIASGTTTGAKKVE
jgi:sterol desaturase/sphingolipid hydroxylase (fatty acid hydroxylase superfamily)